MNKRWKKMSRHNIDLEHRTTGKYKCKNIPGDFDFIFKQEEMEGWAPIKVLTSQAG